MFYVKEYNKVLLLALALTIGLVFPKAIAAEAQQTTEEKVIAEPVRLSPNEVYQQVSSGKALLVCAYQNEEECRKIMLEGAISLKELESRLPGLSKDQGIIFY